MSDFHFSDGFVRKLFELTDGRIPSGVFESSISQLEMEAAQYHFTTSAESNFIRIFSSMYDRNFFFSELPKYPHHAEIIIAITSSSNYLTDISVRNPEYLYQLFNQEYLSRTVVLSEIEEELKLGVEKFKSFNARLNYIRQFKKRITLKIGVNDILHFDSLLKTTEQLSSLATAINAQLFEICLNEIKNKYSLEEIKSKYALCSLGKHGGNELNYSSDVDLLLFYDFNEAFPKIKRDYHEILSETIQLFAKSSSDLTSNGYIYRVDFRLRPDGKYSPLCKALDDYIKYYEVRGEDWERQMLIKLDFIGGDRSLYNRFMNFVTPYVYGSNLSASIKDKIKAMKRNIERHYNKGENVKTFSGGIRDIEFTVQALQLLNGGKEKSLRNGNTLITLNNLEECKLIGKSEKESLENAYIFYRKIEHFLQLMNDTQTHLIPDDEELLNKIVRYLQLDSIPEFKETLEKHRKKVRKIYDRVLLTESSDILVKEKIFFKDASKAEKNLLYLRSGQGILERKEFDARTIGYFNSIEPQLLKYLATCPDPDRVIENFTRVVRNTKYASFLYQEFLNPKFFENALNIFCYSQKASDLLALSTSLEEFFLTRKVFIKNPTANFDELKIEQIIFTLAIQYTLGLIDSQKVSEILSLYVSHVLSEILKKQNLNYKFFVAGLGSFGSFSMNFSSDIDLIVVADDIQSSERIQQDFQDFLASALNKLKPFEIDFRLRPEGKKSPLVWDLKNYIEYLDTRARIWEMQSLTKIRLVYGYETLYKKFRKAAADRIAKLDEKEIKAEIRKMNSAVQQQVVKSSGTFNIKKERGGLFYLDFILQYHLLKNKNHFLKANGKNIPKMLQLIKEELDGDFDIIVKNYRTMKNWEIAIQNLYNTNKSATPSNPDAQKILVSFLNMNDAQDFDKLLREIIRANTQLFDKYLGG